MKNCTKYLTKMGQYQTSPLKKNPKGTFYNFIDVTLVQMIVK